MNEDRHIVETSKLEFHKVKEKHINEGWLSWLNSENTVRHLAASGKKYTEDDLCAYLENISKNKDIFLAAYTKIEKIYIGNLRLYEFDSDEQSCWYGRIIGNTEFQGQGLGTEMLLAAEKYCLQYTQMRRLQTLIMKKNVASLLSNIKAGMIVKLYPNNENQIYCYKDIR